MRFLYFIIALIIPATGISQIYDPLHPPNSYRNATNPEYWKNRKPYEGYWQQDVHYTIQAKLDERTHIISGKEFLTYWNNSPDSLNFVYFHLYQNAFQPGSYYDNLLKENGYPTRYGQYEASKKGTEIVSIKINGELVKTELDNTILKVFLPEAIKAGGKAAFEIEFKTYFDSGSSRRRMKLFKVAHGYKHFDGVHWYPRISVYDRKFGWDTDQHLDKEFYGDFGTYDVELTMASNYVVEATGFLQNRNEVLPEDLRKKLDLKNFVNRKSTDTITIITPYNPKETKTWIYHAENVHDFAFTADPTYRIDEKYWGDIQCVAMVREQNAAKWINAADYASKVIKVYSENFGQYIYPKMVVADAEDGMEYPMLTLDAGQDPNYRSLLAHEIGHNWFFGMVGSNETYRAALDEGFTQFLDSWAYKIIDGDTVYHLPSSSAYHRKFRKETLVRNSRVFDNYIYTAAQRDDRTLNTHSSDFDGGSIRHDGGYGQVYYKTSTMLYNLQYVLGDSLFQAAMKHYFNQWKTCHPYFEDFRNSIISYAHVDLNWFFDQWLETTKVVDYSLSCIKKGKEKDQYILTFKRKGEMQMPIDFQVISNSDSVANYHIPNTWFVKKTSATVLPKWYGWGNLQPEYEAIITVPGGIYNVVIDPSNRLADVNMLNNSKKLPYIVDFDARLNNPLNRSQYELNWRPDLWYNRYDGVKAGLHLNGNYLRNFHVFDLTFWFNTGMGQADFPSSVYINKYNAFSYRINYSTLLPCLSKNTKIDAHSSFLDGLQHYELGMSKFSKSRNDKVRLSLKALYRQNEHDLNYLLLPNEWLANKWNNTLNLDYTHIYHYPSGQGEIKIGLRTSVLGSNYDYSTLRISAVNHSRIDKMVFSTRFFAQVGTGANVALESSLFAAGANPEEMMDNKYTRSAGVFSAADAAFSENTGVFHAGGGLNLRGYSGYLMAESSSTDPYIPGYKGISGTSFSAELEFSDYFRWFPARVRQYIEFDTYLFSDAGLLVVPTGSIQNQWGTFSVDAGAGTTFKIKKFGRLEAVKPLVVRFDFPLFLSRTPYASPDNLQFRWIVGVNRAF
ncbi:MAG: M1 family metallopeptidase [Flavobacteriales bacterium]